MKRLRVLPTPEEHLADEAWRLYCRLERARQDFLSGSDVELPLRVLRARLERISRVTARAGLRAWRRCYGGIR